MVVLIDTNVIIDFLVAREPFYDSALHVMEKCASGEAEGYIAFHSLPKYKAYQRKIRTRQIERAERIITTPGRKRKGKN